MFFFSFIIFLNLKKRINKISKIIKNKRILDYFKKRLKKAIIKKENPKKEKFYEKDSN